MRKLNSIEYLKAFSMFYIVGFWHLSDYTAYLSINKNQILSDTTLITLSIFVLISGFLLGKTNKQPVKFLTFLKKRLFRIYPLYALAVIIFYFFSINDLLISIKSLFFISMFIGPAPFTLWFITMIMIFYLLTPFLISLSNKIINYFLFVLLISLLFFILIFFFKNIDYRIVFYFPIFCLGIFCATQGIKTKFINLYSALALFLIGILLESISINSWLITQFLKLPVIISSSYIILYISITYEYKFKSISIINTIGYSSFSIYLFHRPIYTTLIYLFFPNNKELQFLYLLFVCFPIICFISWLLQKSYDYLVFKIG